MVKKLGFCIFATFAILIFSSLLYAHETSETEPCATVRGFVLDMWGARIPGRKVIFSSEAGEFETVSDEIGEYELKLPAGLFEIQNTINGKYGDEVWNFKRSKIKVSCQDNLEINFYPVSGEEVKRFDGTPHTFVSLGKDWLGKEISSEIVISYGQKTSSGKKTVYKYVYLTYDTLTIKATTLEQDNLTKTFTASGKFWAEYQGKPRTCFNSLRFDPGNNQIEGKIRLFDQSCIDYRPVK